MSMALVTTGGFGNGTLTTTIADIVRRGYSVGSDAATAIPGLEYHLNDDRPHYRLKDDRTHYTVSDDRLHYKVDR